MIGAYVTPDEYVQVREAATASGATLSSFLRAAVLSWLSRSHADQATAEREAGQ